jgi:MFS family permease
VTTEETPLEVPPVESQVHPGAAPPPQRWWRAFTIDVRPLRSSREFRLLWTGQSISYIGSQVAAVALPFQAYELTHSSLAVGLIGACELAPMLLLSLVGGALADARDRRRLVLEAELGLMAVSLLLMANALLRHPMVWALYVLAAIGSSLVALSRPSLTAMLPRLVSKEEMPGAIALETITGGAAMIAGPAVAGLLIAGVGLSTTYAVDAASFVASLGCLLMMRSVPPPGDAPAPGFRSIIDGLRYVRGRPVLQGTYLLDYAAMVFGMPRALFPALALGRFGGGPRILGLLYAAPALGGFLLSATSGWTGRIRHHGRAITWAVLTWGGATAAFGLSHRLWLALVFLAIAGGADLVSGLFRMQVWNETIPDELRGRLAGVEWANVASGPLLGDVEAGVVGSWRGPGFSVVSGGVACIVAAVVLAALLPGFLAYDAGARTPSG